MALYVRDGGSWKAATLYVRDAGAWKLATGYVRNGGAWTQFTGSVHVVTPGSSSGDPAYVDRTGFATCGSIDTAVLGTISGAARTFAAFYDGPTNSALYVQAATGSTPLGASWLASVNIVGPGVSVTKTGAAASYNSSTSGGTTWEIWTWSGTIGQTIGQAYTYSLTY